MGGAFAAGIEYARDLDKYRVAQLAEEAQAVAGQSDEELLERFKADERRVDVLAAAVEGARRSSWEAKRITMGRVLGQALSDDADIDYNAALITTLAAIEARHVHYLELLAALEWNEMMPPKDGRHGLVPEPFRAALVSNGLVQTGSSYEGQSRIVALTSYGHDLLAWLRAAKQDGMEGAGAPGRGAQ